jgi:hypothetical protein
VPALPHPDPLTLKRAGRGQLQMQTDCKRLFAAGEHPQTRISIHRCYKLSPAATMRGVWRGRFRAIGPALCKILYVNFREFLFHALR